MELFFLSRSRNVKRTRAETPDCAIAFVRDCSLDDLPGIGSEST